MQPPDTPELLQDARQLSEMPLAPMLSKVIVLHEDLFPSDVLLGDSLLSQYRQWVERQLKPKLKSLGEEGQAWWKIMTRVDLLDHPDLFSQVLMVLAAWYFPDAKNYLATAALLIAIRRVGDSDREP